MNKRNLCAGLPSRAGAPGCGFTLIELLVVVSVIALLIGLLVPTIGRARTSALNVQDLSNLRQIAIAWGTYRIDHDNKPPVGPNIVEGSTFTVYNRNAWYSVGKTPHPAIEAWTQTGYIHESNRPLNAYMIDDLERLEYDAGGLPLVSADKQHRADLLFSIRDGIDTRAERPFFRAGRDAPGNPTSDLIQTDSRIAGQSLLFNGNLPDSVYDLTGTSYFNNNVVLDSPGYDCFGTSGSRDSSTASATPEEVRACFDQAYADLERVVAPSRTVILTEAPLLLGFGSGTTLTSFAGAEATYYTAFGDGHVKTITIEDEHTITGDRTDWYGTVGIIMPEGPEYAFQSPLRRTEEETPLWIR
ncbi:MAG: type II secretion system protein [Planctomycetota bacterium]